MLVSENDYLCDNLFEFCCEMCVQVLCLQNVILLEERDVFCLVGELVVVVVLCLMSGYYDCLLYIVVNVEKLECCLIGLILNIYKLNKLVLIIYV